MKVLVMTAIYPSPEDPALGTFVRTQVESLEKAGVDIQLFVLNGPSRKWNYPKAIFQLRQRLANRSIDLIHAHYSYVGIVARTQWKVPVVVTYHGGDLMGLINERGKKTLWSPLAVATGLMLARCVEASIVQTAEMASLLNNRPNVFTIPHEVDFAVFRPTDKQKARTALGLQRDKKYILFAAHPENPFKRFPFAKAVAEHLTRHSASVELLVVFKETQERLALYMSACDALIFPSYQEGSPNVVKQAMACNLPIVATNVGDVRQVIGETEGCCVCEPSVEDFSARIIEVLARSRRTDGRERVRHLDPATVSERIIEVYERVLRDQEKRVAGRSRRDVAATVKSSQL